MDGRGAKRPRLRTPAGGHPSTLGRGRDDASGRGTVLFVCRHGAAKSVLAAAECRMIAATRGVDLEAVATGLEPDSQVAQVLIDALPEDRLEEYRPRAVTPDDLAAASRVITFSLSPDELPVACQSIERWDDVPSVSEDLHGARDAIRRHLVHLIDGYARPAGA